VVQLQLHLRVGVPGTVKLCNSNMQCSSGFSARGGGSRPSAPPPFGYATGAYSTERLDQPQTEAVGTSTKFWRWTTYVTEPSKSTLNCLSICNFIILYHLQAALHTLLGTKRN